MKVLLIGAGGREDALAWALRRSPRLTALRCAPGNAGIARRAECVNIAADDVAGLVDHAVTEAYDLVVVGPEAPLVEGLVDALTTAGIAAFGPTAGGARLEGSKAFAREFMDRHGVPSADYRVFDAFESARAYLESPQLSYPRVVKADGLAAGKGVLICDDARAAVDGARSMLVDNAFGEAGKRIVVEECLVGREASFFVLADGDRYVELATCQDYKRALEEDRGPNTGGMGTYSPSVYLDAALCETIRKTIVEPVIRGMAEEGHPYRGVLYVGVMLTSAGPRVLEFNARFGDPETQVLMPRLDGDWLTVLDACARGELAGVELGWKDEAAVCVVMASGGYPGAYGKGAQIVGIEAAEALDDVIVFHAGTRPGNGGFETAGGRVLGVTALGQDLAAARERAYEAVARISWAGEQHRRDIAADALRRIDERNER